MTNAQMAAILIAFVSVSVALATLLWRISSDLKADLRQDLANFKSDLHNEVAATRTEAREDVREIRGVIFGRADEPESDPFPPSSPGLNQ